MHPRRARERAREIPDLLDALGHLVPANCVDVLTMLGMIHPPVWIRKGVIDGCDCKKLQSHSIQKPEFRIQEVQANVLCQLSWRCSCPLD